MQCTIHINMDNAAFEDEPRRDAMTYTHAPLEALGTTAATVDATVKP